MPRCEKKKLTYHGILFGHKKEAVLPLMTTWIKLEGIMLSEIPSDLTCMENLKKQQQSEKWICRYKDTLVAASHGKGGEQDEFGKVFGKHRFHL